MADVAKNYFDQLDKDHTGVLTGGQVKDLFMKSGLSREKLSEVGCSMANHSIARTHHHSLFVSRPCLTSTCFPNLACAYRLIRSGKLR